MATGFDDVALLPVPTVIEDIDFETILVDRKTNFGVQAQAKGFNYDLFNLESSTAVVLLEEGSYREVILRERGNFIGRQRYLYFAEDTGIDHLGFFYDCVRLPGEDDDRYKSRIILAIQGRSTGGTAPRYKGRAMAVSLRVSNAFVYRDGIDPTVHIAIFAADNGGVADADLLAAVSASLNDPEFRMVNDTLDIRSAVVQVQNIVADVTLLPDTPQGILDTLEASLPNSWIAESGLGRDLTHDWLKSKLVVSGSVYGVTITTPPATVVSAPYTAIRIGTVTLNFAGRNY